RFQYAANMNQAHRAWQEGEISRTLEILEEHRPKQLGDEDLRGFEWFYTWRLCHADLRTLRGHANHITCVAFSPDGACVASGSRDGTVRVWDTVTGKQIVSLKGTRVVLSVTFSRDGKRLAFAGKDVVKVCDTAIWQEVCCLKVATSFNSVDFSSDG